MSFPINTTIPAAGNSPSNDQPLMLQNNININSYVSVDHIVPGATLNGFHGQSSYVAQPTITTLANGTNFQNSSGIAYVNSTNVGGATFVNDYYYFNGNGINQSTYPLNSIRAYALITTPTTITNGFNVTLVVKGGVGIYAVAFSQPASGTNYGVLVTAIRPTGSNTVVIPTVTLQNAGSIQITFVGVAPSIAAALIDPTAFTVAILGV
jgi:hypothetical protein